MYNDEIFRFPGEAGIEMDSNETDFRKAGMELAQAYVPFQTFRAENLYSPEDALLKGTIFPELYRPYEARCAAKPEKRVGLWA